MFYSSWVGGVQTVAFLFNKQQTEVVYTRGTDMDGTNKAGFFTAIITDVKSSNKSSCLSQALFGLNLFLGLMYETKSLGWFMTLVSDNKLASFCTPHYKEQSVTKEGNWTRTAIVIICLTFSFGFDSHAISIHFISCIFAAQLFFQCCFDKLFIILHKIQIKLINLWLNLQ